MIDVLIVGAGITGLAAAWELRSSGLDVAVLEAGSRPGGKIRTERRDGFLIEHGPDSLISYRPAALELISELGLADEVIRVQEPRTVFLRVNGRLRPMPEGMGLVLPTRLRPFVGTRVLSWPQKVRAGGDLLLPRVLGQADMSVGGLLRRRLGDGVVERFVDPLLGGVYGASVDELSVDAVVPTLRASEQTHRSLMLASLAQGRAARRAGRTGAAPFRSLRGGLGTLVEVLTTALAECDVPVHTSCAAAGLGPDGGGPGVRAELADGTSLAARTVILACGPHTAAQLLGEWAPLAAEELRAIPLGTTTSVHLGFAAEAFPDAVVGHGHLEAGRDRPPVSAVTIVSNKWPGRAPAGSVLVRAFVPDRVGQLAHASDADVLAAVTDHVTSVLGARRPPLLNHVVRWPQAMPKYVVGHRDRVARIEGALPGTVRLAGSAVHGVGVPDCVADGRAVGAELRRQLQAAPV